MDRRNTHRWYQVSLDHIEFELVYARTPRLARIAVRELHPGRRVTKVTPIDGYGNTSRD